MKTNTILGLAVLGIAAYYLLRKKPIKAEDLQKQPDNVIPAVIRNYKAELKVSDLSSRGRSRSGPQQPVIVKSSRVILDVEKPSLKTPIYENPINSIPNVYDRGVGQELNFSGNDGFYNNMGGDCTVSIQDACACMKESRPKYMLDIPQLP